MNKERILSFVKKLWTKIRDFAVKFSTEILPKVIGKIIVVLRQAWQWGKKYGSAALAYTKENWRSMLLQAVPYAIVIAVTATVTGLIVSAPYWKIGGYTKLGEMEALIADRFIGEVDQTEIEDAAAHAMIGALGDRWSYYIPADEYADYLEQKQNAYVGIGVTIRQRADKTGLDIIEVTEGGSAQQAGILPEDILVAVDDQPIAQLDSDAVKNLIRGEVGTKVKISVLRDGQELSCNVTRRQIVTPVALGRMVNATVGVVKIGNFNDHCAEETVAAIEALRQQGAQKLIFDVRNNPGGYATELVAVLDYLLPEGVLFRSEDYRGREEIRRSDASFLDMPMAVLVNGSSYSAAEFFAAALSEYEAALVVGEQTSGKGYYQNTYQMPDGSAIGLSVGKYYTPNGVSLEGTGVTPDVVAPVNEQLATGIYDGTVTDAEDPQLQAAIKALETE